MLVAVLSVPLGMVSLGCSSRSSAPSDCSQDYWVATTGRRRRRRQRASALPDDRPGEEDRAHRSGEGPVHDPRQRPERRVFADVSPAVRPAGFRVGPVQGRSTDRRRATPSPSSSRAASSWRASTASSGICTAPVPEWPTGQVARQLYVDGERAVRARSNYVPGAAVQPDNPVYSRIDAGYVPLLGANPPVLHHPEWAEVVTRTQWKMMRCPLTGGESVNLTPEARCWANANAYPIPWNFQLLSWIENAPEYLDQPGMWFLDPEALTVQYRPVGPWTADEGHPPTPRDPPERHRAPATPRSPTSASSGLRFAYATWLGPSVNGYVSDQSGNFLLGPGHVVNGYGHQKVDLPDAGERERHLRTAHHLRERRLRAPGRRRPVARHGEPARRRRGLHLQGHLVVGDPDRRRRPRRWTSGPTPRPSRPATRS